LFLEDVYVPADRLIGRVEGQGLAQAQAVFGYTRLMVGAFGLGAGWEALRRAIRYSQERIQGGAPQPKARLHPQTHRAQRRPAGSGPHLHRVGGGTAGQRRRRAANRRGRSPNIWPPVAGNKAAEDAIQALGGYGYTKEYMVEKIKRDVRITTIYEGTSEIMEWTIARDRWQLHLKSRMARFTTIGPTG
jgi:alkylation response protein AidB-like acyl-CoA dehydrogenase